MKFNRDRFLEEGYVILRQVIPQDQLDDLRAGYEFLVEHQKAIWAKNRKPDDPPGGVWETSPQPRLFLSKSPLADRIDEQTANTVEIWLHENTQGVSNRLMEVEDAGVTVMMFMCSPVRNHGPARWHRDVHPLDTAPLQGYVDDIIEAGPRYVQWNLSLYDDDVLWVMPGSHLRLNTPDENDRLQADPRVPLPGGVQTHLEAGDGVAYILPILHWASNYSNKMRRIIHGGFSNFTFYEDPQFSNHLSPHARGEFERWAKRSAVMQNETESALRACIEKDTAAYLASLENLHPGRREKGRMLSTVYLCKAALMIKLKKHPGLEGVPDEFRRRAQKPHPLTMNWGPEFANRFSMKEADVLWERFEKLDALLQADEEHLSPGFQGMPNRYHFNQMPADFNVEDFIVSWDR